MTPFSQKTLTVLAGLLVVGGLTACQDRDFGLIIRQVQPFDTGSCEVNTDETTFQSSGTVDIALRDSYSIHVLVESSLLDFSEVYDVVLRSATIEFTTLDVISTTVQSPLVVPLSGTVRAGGIVTIGVEVLNSATLAQLRDAQEFLVVDDTGDVRPVRASVKLIARMRIAGETLDGKLIESNEFLYPIDVCNGCSITYPSNLLETRNGQLVCPSVKLDTEGNPVVGPSASSPCISRLGVDGAQVDCQTCQGLAVNAFSRQLCQPELSE